MGWRTMLQKARFVTSVVVLNTATLYFAIWLFQPALLPAGRKPVTAAHTVAITTPSVVAPLPSKAVVSGRPVRIEVNAPDNGMHIDLAVEDGFFDPKTQQWTLSNSKAYFATPSVLANDSQGTTLIYGHNDEHLFGVMNSLKQNVGAYALVYTDNGKVFRYSYADAKNLQPNDTSVFTNQGAPTLVVQTCAGDWFQFRRMYRFSFVSVGDKT